jgi:hypothetical protein
MLKLKDSGEQLASICRRVEIKAELPPQLGDLELPVTLVPDFEDIASRYPSKSDFIEHNEAIYLVHEEAVLVNESCFFDLSAAAATATIAHEVGHHVFAKAREVNYDLGYRDLHEEIVVDLLACDWGFYEEICELRRARYGNNYCLLLGSREKTEDFTKRVNDWFQGHLLDKTLYALKWKY